MKEWKKFINQLQRYKENELKELKKEKKKGIPVRLNPNSYYAKELEYQTLLLKNIQRGLLDIKKLLSDKSVNINKFTKENSSKKTKYNWN